jgi:methionyl-tRNA formyltransferase
MIYLFSNRSYGAPFLDAAARYSRRTNLPITAVFSGQRQRDRQEGGPVGMLRSFAARWRSNRESVAAGLPLLFVDDVNAPAFVEKIEPGDIGIIAGFDQIFGAEAIARFTSFVNVHPSLLPFYRGPEPAYWCIENAETTTGFTIHTVTTKIDSGEIHHQEMLSIGPADDAGSLTVRIATLAVPAFERWLDHVARGTPWTPARVDAGSAYRRHVDYKSFHDAGAQQQQRK